MKTYIEFSFSKTKDEMMQRFTNWRISIIL